ncbi:MAG: 16S rRNA (guanine(966)-N(2))-methyltransferase RsmD [Gammaproteobacteria bacterium WSBS_2016_MAG_OTU1]
MSSITSLRRPVFRIIGGQWRGRKVHFIPSVRASGDRVRESLFNCLGDISGYSCLDLFAGAGALGLEAASRGASNVVCVERNDKIATALRQTATVIAADNVQVRNMPAASFLSRNTTKFDIIFLDPPFADYTVDEKWQQLLTAAAAHLAADGMIYCESVRHFAPPDGWHAVQRKMAGSVRWQLLHP